MHNIKDLNQILEENVRERERPVFVGCGAKRRQRSAQTACAISRYSYTSNVCVYIIYTEILRWDIINTLLYGAFSFKTYTSTVKTIQKVIYSPFMPSYKGYPRLSTNLSLFWLVVGGSYASELGVWIQCETWLVWL